MGAEIDRLEVQVEAQATKANNALDKLTTKLDKLSASLSHLNSSGLTGLANGVSKFAQASAQLSNVHTADFTRLTKNIQNLAALNTQQLYSAASAMQTLSTALNSLGGVAGNSAQVAELAKAISKLGGVNVQRAITNLPQLATAMNDLMTTLSRAPQVSSNVIQMTRALADLASQGNRVGTAGNSLVRSLNSTGSAMAASTKKAWSFSSAIGSIYQKYFWIRRIGSKLWSSIEKSMSYVETLNYFDAAFEQVADSAVSQMGTAGEEAAEAYYESFSSRAKELTSKMTGFSVNDDGTLTATGNASLGIDPSKLMNYQATFAQMSSSMGVTSETSLLLSQALTEIGADLASVKNLDFEDVWTDMASGLAGMSRTMDKYGVNIRNVNLQQKLLELGINENITNLNQNDKALLRTIILLESTEYAWGDLADTINQPANQIRLLESNISNLSRTLGNLFLPAVSKVLPVVNGLVIAVQRLFTWIGSLMGIDLSAITSAVGSSEIDTSELLGDTDDLTDSLDSASDAAKKLKSNLQGFDELNVITTSDDSASGSGTGLTDGLLDDAFLEAYSKYQQVWDEAFAKMENRANEFADKIGEIFKPISEPFKRMLLNLKFGGWTQAGENLSDIVVGFHELLISALESVDWESIGHNIGLFLKGIDWIEVIKTGFELRFDIAKAIAEVWFGSFKAAPFETTVMTAMSVLTFTGLGKSIATKIVAKITGELTTDSAITALATGFKALLGSAEAESALASMSGTTKFFTGLGTVVAGAMTSVSSFVSMFVDGFSWIKEAVMLVGIALTAVGAIILGAPAAVAGVIAGIVAGVATLVIVIKDNWEAIKNFTLNLVEKIGGFFGGLWDGIKAGLNSVINWFQEGLGKLGEKLDNFLGNHTTGISGGIAVNIGSAAPAYATGGFPEDGLFYANHNELVGEFTNGKTAVANNEQIIAGIEQGVRDANAEQAALLREQNSLLQAILEKETGISASDIFKSVRKSASDYTKRTGSPAF